MSTYKDIFQKLLPEKFRTSERVSQFIETMGEFFDDVVSLERVKKGELSKGIDVFIEGLAKLLDVREKVSMFKEYREVIGEGNNILIEFSKSGLNSPILMESMVVYLNGRKIGRDIIETEEKGTFVNEGGERLIEEEPSSVKYKEGSVVIVFKNPPGWKEKVEIDYTVYQYEYWVKKDFLKNVASFIGLDLKLYHSQLDYEESLRTQIEYAIDLYKSKGLHKCYLIFPMGFWFRVEVVLKWTDDYVNFYESPQGEIYPDGDWYATPHANAYIKIRKQIKDNVLIDEEISNVVETLAQRYRPVHVVFDWFGFVIDLYCLALKGFLGTIEGENWMMGGVYMHTQWWYPRWGDVLVGGVSERDRLLVPYFGDTGDGFDECLFGDGEEQKYGVKRQEWEGDTRVKVYNPYLVGLKSEDKDTEGDLLTREFDNQETTVAVLEIAELGWLSFCNPSAGYGIKCFYDKMEFFINYVKIAWLTSEGDLFITGSRLTVYPNDLESVGVEPAIKCSTGILECYLHTGDKTYKVFRLDSGGNMTVWASKGLYSNQPLLATRGENVTQDSEEDVVDFALKLGSYNNVIMRGHLINDKVRLSVKGKVKTLAKE